jgi:hypothetical protein
MIGISNFIKNQLHHSDWKNLLEVVDTLDIAPAIEFDDYPKFTFSEVSSWLKNNKSVRVQSLQGYLFNCGPCSFTGSDELFKNFLVNTSRAKSLAEDLGSNFIIFGAPKLRADYLSIYLLRERLQFLDDIFSNSKIQFIFEPASLSLGSKVINCHDEQLQTINSLKLENFGRILDAENCRSEKLDFSQCVSDGFFDHIHLNTKNYGFNEYELSKQFNYCRNLIKSNNISVNVEIQNLCSGSISNLIGLLDHVRN